MKKNRLIIVSVIALLASLYFIEISKVKNDGVNNMPTLDNLQTDEVSANWEPFYKVRATIIDGQSAGFSVPDELRNKAGKGISLLGAVVFRGNGCELIDNDKTRVHFSIWSQRLDWHRPVNCNPMWPCAGQYGWIWQLP